MASTSISEPHITPTGIYINPSASNYFHGDSSNGTQPTDPAKIKAFHESLPEFNQTPLHDLPSLAKELGIGRLLIKAESQRLGLPAFKILGASWGVYRALCAFYELVPDPTTASFERLREHIRSQGKQGTARVVLYAATDGNHGRAVARMTKLLGLADEECNTGEVTKRDSCVIYVPNGMYDTTRQLIESEDARVVTVRGDYDNAVAQCWEACLALAQAGNTGGGGSKYVAIMVQDNAFDGYDVVPRWIVEGYSTLLAEVDDQYRELVVEKGVAEEQITHIVTPVGVGSLGHAVVKWAKSAARKERVRVLTVEPATAGCLHESLKAGRSKVIETVDTIMSGMCCGTVSPTSWPDLESGVDVSVTIDDWTCHETVLELQRIGLDAGPCGAGCLAGLKKILGNEQVRKELDMGFNSVVVVLSTEGKREYPVPQRPE